MKKLLNHTLFQQLLFWSLSFFLLHRLFTREGDNGLTDIYFTILFHLPLLLTVYGNYYLVKQFFIKNRKLSFYLLGIACLIVFSVGFHYLTFDVLADWIFSGYYFVSFYEIRAIVEFVVSYAIISTLLFLSKNWFRLKEQQLALEKENHRVKLASLKAQINPHFLFNSLNNIYGITTAENKLGRDYLLKLSDALRYMIYDTTESFVPLEKEIDYLKNYVALEKLRLEAGTKIGFQTEGTFSGYLIAPLILLPIVENCFKYFNTEHPFVNISLNMKNELFTIEAINSKRAEIGRQSGGLGLTNLKNRLQLIYPDKHQLTITDKPNSYTISLAINLENDL